MKLMRLALAGILLVTMVRAIWAAAGIEQWSVTPGSNTSDPPVGAPEGMAPSAVNNTMREMMSYLAIYAKQEISAHTAPDSGSANAYVISPTITRRPSSAVSGAVYRFKASANNTSTQPTLSVSGETGITIVKLSGAALNAGDIVQDMWHEVVYDGTNYVLMNPGSSIAVTPGATGQVLQSRGSSFTPVFASLITRGRTVSLSPYANNYTSASSSHGLSGTPDFLDIGFVNASAECGYHPGEVLSASGTGLGSQGTNDHSSWTVVKTLTAIRLITQVTNSPVVTDATTNANCTATGANWALVITPYKFSLP